VPLRKNPDSRYWQAIDTATAAAEHSIIPAAFEQYPKLSSAAEYLGISEAHLSRRCEALGLRHLYRKNLDRADEKVVGAPGDEE